MNEENLIFLISQPRSGSSLTQQLLLNNDDIVSSPETWQMLSLVHTYKKTSISSGYNPSYSSINYLEYLSSIENGLQILKKNIKQIAISLYEKKNSEGKYFLDKTPRYYHIIDELYELFPNAKFVFLVRNPLAVFSSILNYNFNGKANKFLQEKDRLDDLFLAPKKINEAMKKYQNHHFLCYEDLVVNPQDELEKVFNYLKLDKPSGLGSYKLNQDFEQSGAVDTKSLGNHNEATDAYINTWRKSIDTSQKKRLAQDYIKKLIDMNFDYFGYNLKETLEELNAYKPTKNYIFNLSLEDVMKDDKDLSLIKVIKKRLINRINS